MAGVRDIKIRFSGDSSGLAKAAQEGEQSVGRFSEKTQKWAKVGLAATAAIGAAALAGAKSAIDAASDLSEAQSKAANVFGAANAQIQDFAKTSAGSFGISKRAALGYTSAIGSIAVAQGQTQDQAAALSLSYTKLAADLASFNNTSIEEAAEALKASVTGEFEQLKKYGIVINDARLQSEAAALGITKVGNAFTAAQKQTIAQAIIMKDSAQAQGDFARTSDGLANQQRILQARMDDLQSSIGTKLLPIMLALASAFQSVLTWVQNNQTQAKILAGVIGGLVAVIFTVSAAITAWTAITRTAAAVQAAWNAVMAANPLVLITLAVIALIAVIVLIATKTTWFQDIWRAAMGAIQGAISGVFNWIRSNWPLILAILTGPVGLAVLAVVKNFDRIKDAAVSVKDAITKAFSTVAGVITAPFEAAVRGIKAAWNSTIGGKGINIPKIDLGFTSIGGGGFTIPMLAKGGNITRSGLALVGEQGPELLNLNRGAQVTPLGDGLGGDLVVELHARDGVTLEGLVEKVIVRRDRATRSAVLAGSRRALV